MDPSDASWLAEQCGLLPRVLRGILLRPADGGPEQVVAWPGGAPPAPELVVLAHAALTQRGPRAEPRPPRPGAPLGSLQLGVPLPGARAGAVAIEVSDAKESEASLWLERLRAGAAWRDALARRDAVHARRAELLEITATALAHEELDAALTALATELAVRLGCERVAIGLLERERLRVRALSHSAAFDPRSALLEDLAAAMDEAIVQDATVAVPAPAGAPGRADRAHAALRESHGAGAVWSLPLAAHGRTLGALSCELPAGRALDERALRLTEQAAPLLAGAVALQCAAAAPLRARFGRLVERRLAPLLGTREGRVGLAVAAALVLALLLAPATHRVAADARLEGRIQRAVVAGFEGYLVQVEARPGDTVRAGQVLASLDDRDLRVERQKWEGRREQLRREHREALAAHDRTEQSIVAARVAQADAQLALLDALLARTALVAPFDGVVVRGDLQQRLGSPVEKGEVLFEVAPLDGYRVVLEIDEADVAFASAGQHGQLRVSALPGEALPFVVERVTPVAVAAEGANRFRAEARLERPSDSLRPGMTGVARIEAGRRARIWIWTHQTLAWLRLALWSWGP